ncbi:transposase, partial [Halochromatium roseum]|nr:transposase [Halochromatium roseum]MBK5941401.1 transposase [Halochromatium roseum]
MAAVEVVIPEAVEEHVKAVFDQLNEKHRRWVAGLLSEIVGYGGTKWAA